MYDYKKERSKLFTEEGVVLFTKIRDRVVRLLRESEAFTSGAAVRGATGDTWMTLACVDRLVELGEIKEVTDPTRVRGQDRVFVSGAE